MAKTQKFSEDLLLEAVVKFSEICNTKIKATKLAEWSRKNIVGLEEVRDYHFTRPIKYQDKKGNIKERQKLCTERIEQINKSRSMSVAIGKNCLLRASSINDFFELTYLQQRQIVSETRQLVDQLEKQRAYLQRNNDYLHAENAKLLEENKVLLKRLDAAEKQINEISRKINHAFKQADEDMRIKTLNNMGIADEKIDLLKNAKSIEEDKNVYEMFSEMAKRRKPLDEGNELLSRGLKAFVMDGLKE